MIFAEEWPLMTFTLLMQLSVGMFVIILLIQSMTGKQEMKVSKALKGGMNAVGPVTLGALIISLFHLGDPLGAPRSLLNLGSSWLSREILTAGCFFILWLITAWLMRTGKENKALGWLTACVGLAAIFSMAHIYSSSIRPAWANVNTYLAFFGATLAMGVLGAISTLALGLKGSDFSAALNSTMTKISYLGTAGVILPLAYLPLFFSGLSAGGTTGEASARILTGSISLLLAGALLSLAGVFLPVFVLRKQGNRTPVGIILLAFLFVLIGEFMGRYLFYACGVSPMIGG